MLAALLIVLLAGRDGEPESQPLSDDSHAVAVIDPATNRVTTAAPVGSNPGPLAFEPESRYLWVANIDDESVTRIDSDPVTTGKTIAIGERPNGLAAGDGVVWVTAAPRRRPYVTALRVDARFDTPSPPVRIASVPGDGSASVALGGASVWVAPSLGRLTRLDAGATSRSIWTIGAWAAAYPDPIDFLRQLDGRSIRAEDNFNAAYFDDPEYDRRLDAADGLPSPARELALGRLDVHVARTAAPWAVVANARTHDFFSARIGCQVYNPVLGLDLGSLCIRSRE